MKHTVFLAIATMLSVTNASPTPPPQTLDSRATVNEQLQIIFQNEMLNSHNFFRGQHGANPLVWDNSLAQASQGWADTCNFYHDSAGENLAYRTSFNYWGELVNMWGSERLNYNFNNPTFSDATGHFTQVVWKNTQSVGCGYKYCTGGDNKAYGWYVVCKYNPPGNYLGQFADQVGRQTSGSPSDVYVSKS